MTTRLRETEWMSWDELPWVARADRGSDVVQLCDRLLRTSLRSKGLADLLRSELPAIATEFSVQWAAVMQRTPDWKIIAECGRSPMRSVPFQFLAEALDREAGGLTPLEDLDGWTLAVVPLASESSPGGVVVLAGRNLDSDILSSAVVVARALSVAMAVASLGESSSRRIEQLRTILQIASSFASTRESGPLLELIAREATRLLDCERASIFIWDREQHEVIAVPALGVEGNTLRLPDNAGIVGEVLRSGVATRVDDCYADPRFSRTVDQKSGFTTRNMLCWPLRDANGELIGAFQAMNKRDGAFTKNDEESLTQLSVQAAIAIRNTREREQLVRSIKQLTEKVTQGIQIIGESPAIIALRATVKRLAETDLPVLILGESGTGKEVVAQALHYQGSRAGNPFIAVNCAALTETLLESELFGHEKARSPMPAKRGKANSSWPSAARCFSMKSAT